MATPLFKDIGKTVKDFLSKKFKDDTNVKFENSVENLKIQTTASYDQDASVFGGEVTTTYNRGNDYEVVVKANTNNTYEITGKALKPRPNIKIALSGKNAKYNNKVQKHGVVDVSYKVANYTGQVIATPQTSGLTDVDVSATIGEDNLSVGASYPFQFGGKNSAKLFEASKLSTGIQWTPKDMTATVLCKPQGVVEIGFVHQATQATTFGGRFTSGASPSLEIATSHKIDTTTNFHGLFNTSGVFKGVLEKQFAEPRLSVALTSAYDFSSGAPQKVGKTGIQFRIGDA